MTAKEGDVRVAVVHGCFLAIPFSTISSENVPYEHAQWCVAINALMIVASLSDLLCSARQGLINWHTIVDARWF